MACKKQGVLFSGTKEQEAALKEVISELKGTKGALMPIMQKAQDIYGYLPIEVQTMISDETGIPLEKIYGVATFYAQFALQPRVNIRFLSVLVQPVTSRAPARFTISWLSFLALPTENALPMVNFP